MKCLYHKTGCEEGCQSSQEEAFKKYEEHMNILSAGYNVPEKTNEQTDSSDKYLQGSHFWV